MADGANECTSTETATAVVARARSLQEVLPGDDRVCKPDMNQGC